MSGHKPFAALNSRDSYYVKALYYAFGWNRLVDAIKNPAFSATMKVDAIEFASLYRDQFVDADHVISIDDSFQMFLAGKKVFKRD